MLSYCGGGFSFVEGEFGVGMEVLIDTFIFLEVEGVGLEQRGYCRALG